MFKYVILGWFALGALVTAIEWAWRKFSKDGRELDKVTENSRQENSRSQPKEVTNTIVVSRGGCLGRLGSVAIITLIAIIMTLPLKDGDSIRDAAKNVIVQQTPYALEILAARHPLKVGLLRSIGNDQGQMDKAASDYVRSQMTDQGGGTFESYLVYYFVVFDKDAVRKAMADQMEKELGLR